MQLWVLCEWLRIQVASDDRRGDLSSVIVYLSHVDAECDTRCISADLPLDFSSIWTPFVLEPNWEASGLELRLDDIRWVRD